MSFFNLPNQSLCEIGKMLIMSGAIFESGLGEFLEAEGCKISRLSEMYGKTGDSDVSTENLIKVNESIKDLICCLATIEGLVVEKIKIGQELIDKTDPCPPHICKCKGDHCI